MALLTNPTGIEVQLKFLIRGEFRYVNNTYKPDDNVTTWVLSEAMDNIVNESGWISALADAMHEDCTLLSITGRVRGRADAGTTLARTPNQPGLKTGAPAPRWLTVNIWEVPDNENIMEVNAPFSPFKPGRMAMPGLAAADLDGEDIATGSRDEWAAWCAVARFIPAAVGHPDTPAFSLIMTRHRTIGTPPNTSQQLVQVTNVLDLNIGLVGTQLTAR